MTFSIAAWDPEPDPPEWGVAVASKFLAVGSVVPFVRAGVGSVVTQAMANLSYGPVGLELLEAGRSASEVVAELTEADEGRNVRQLGVVDAAGGAATFTGSDCFEWAGGVLGDGFCCQGNILVGPSVVEAMARAFDGTGGDLAVRLLASLEAGDMEGGDRRGRQSAALLVGRVGGGYGGMSDNRVDLRVDDHPAPVTELRRLFEIHKLLFPRKEDLRFTSVDEELAGRMRESLNALGFDAGDGSGYDERLKRALFEYVGTENLEERWSDGDEVDEAVADHLLRRS